MLLIKSLKNPTDNFNIFRLYIATYPKLSFSIITRPGLPTASSNLLLSHLICQSIKKFLLQQNSRIWNALPVIDLSAQSNSISRYSCGTTLLFILIHADDTCSFSFLCSCQKCYNAPLPINHKPAIGHQLL